MFFERIFFGFLAHSRALFFSHFGSHFNAMFCLLLFFFCCRFFFIVSKVFGKNFSLTTQTKYGALQYRRKRVREKENERILFYVDACEWEGRPRVKRDLCFFDSQKFIQLDFIWRLLFGLWDNRCVIRWATVPPLALSFSLFAAVEYWIIHA